ncbi:PTS sugar transporter subunit IIC [Halalkalibacillus sediminis]|uniref:PTS sugar transporter subunit IIC n=1 Tax=Halalkalibacillus sediminis TaxID=2018042 RepID=A0A2I0QYB0_9BACI|nr:PTS sugar transporter subunit IIC [Halalkalibacillus sediminis]PKR79325.1 PTS sugar transporter subunit IIC [Halalkalibacillus sediminis]
MKAFLERKGVQLSFQAYAITALSYMALGLFASLITGVIIKTIGQEIPFINSITWLSEALINMGDFAIQPAIYGGAVGVAIAYGLKAPPLVMFSALFAGAYGAQFEGGGPAGAFVASLIAIEIGKLVSGETKIDIIVTPMVTIFTGFLIASFISPSIAQFLTSFGEVINWATDLRPFIMGILVAALMGLALTAPISSAAIAIMLELEGIAAGAATVGCAAQMIGFAASSYRENGVSGLFSQGLGTSMLQIANIMKNPMILIPPTLTGMILAPVATVWLQMENNAYGAGMGTSGLVGPIMTFNTMGFSIEIVWAVLLLYIIAPAVLSLLVSEWMRKKNLIQYGDMKLQA